MREQTIICTVCPIGCRIHVAGDGDAVASVKGPTCKRGERYARDEFTHPVRIITSSALVEGGTEPLVAVRSDKPVPKQRLFDCMRMIRALRLKAPVERNTVLIENILETGANIIASGCGKEKQKCQNK